MGRAIPAVLLGLLFSVAASAAPTLRVVRGGGEFETLETAITVNDREALTMQWVNDQPGAAGGTWQVLNANAAVVASGQAPAPTLVGHLVRFTIQKGAFLLATAPVSKTAFKIRIRAHDAANQPLGGVSNAVTITQVKAQKQPPVDFGEGAIFPTVEMISFDEKIGVVPLTQIHFAGADVKVRVSNKGKKATDPMWLALKDFNVLMRQSAPVSVGVLQPGASKVHTIHLDAMLPPPKSQLPQAEQYATWSRQYRDLCGVDLRAVLDWRGPQAQAPVNDHRETILALEGWTAYATSAYSTRICEATQCVKPCDMIRNIRAQLDGNVVGYSLFVGKFPTFHSHGHARTQVDGAVAFTPTTKITVASVSKLVTAIAAMRILEKNGVDLDDKIGPFLPDDWSPSTFVKNITFAQLLSHTSGIKDYGNVNQDYARLKAFFTQPVSNNNMTACQPSSVLNPPNPINPNNLGGCYSNYNFAIFRVLLPKVGGFAEDSNLLTRPLTLASQYVKLVQQNVFDRVGQMGVACAPPAGGSHAWAYNMPGTNNGYDWGDVSPQCGAAGWYLSVQDMAKVLLSVSAKDGKILTETSTTKSFDTMRTRSLGLDVANDGEMEKNGGWGAGCNSEGNFCGSITTSAAVFGPVTGPRVVAVLFINSNISGGSSNGLGAKNVLEKAYTASLKPK